MANIVYLDDEKELTQVFELFFQGSVHNIVTFNDEREAINYCTSNPPSLFFVDYRLENMLGDEVAKQVPRDIPVILVTGDITIKSDFEFHDIIEKPFRLNNVLQIVDNLCPLAKA